MSQGGWKWRLVRRIQKWRVKWYKFFLSEQRDAVLKCATVWQPVQINGCGIVQIGKAGGRNVVFGWNRSPGYRNGNSYIEARYPSSMVQIGEGTCLNNNCTICANTTSISIGRDCRIGFGCYIMDSDFHGIHPDERDLPGDTLRDSPVTIGDNVFLGSNVTITKGVVIGDGCVIGAGSVVTKSIPPMTVAAGNPCRIIRAITESDKLSNRLA